MVATHLMSSTMTARLVTPLGCFFVSRFSMQWRLDTVRCGMRMMAFWPRPMEITESARSYDLDHPFSLAVSKRPQTSPAWAMDTGWRARH